MGLLKRITSFFRKDIVNVPEQEISLIHSPIPNSDSNKFNDTETIPNSPDEIKEIPEVFRCRTCGKIFASEIELLNHHKLQSSFSDSILDQNTKKSTCDSYGKKFYSETALMNHTHSIIQNPQIAIYDKIVNYGDTEGFLCKYCGRTFLTDYELQNHIHRQDDILAESDRDLTLPTNSRSKIGIDTQFVNKNEVKVTNLGNERLRYDKFPGKIGYTRKKGN